MICVERSTALPITVFTTLPIAAKVVAKRTVGIGSMVQEARHATVTPIVPTSKLAVCFTASAATVYYI